MAPAFFTLPPAAATAFKQGENICQRVELHFVFLRFVSFFLSRTPAPPPFEGPNDDMGAHAGGLRVDHVVPAFNLGRQTQIEQFGLGEYSDIARRS